MDRQPIDEWTTPLKFILLSCSEPDNRTWTIVKSHRTYLQISIIARLSLILLFDVSSFAVATGKKQLFRENIYNNER